jgi:phage-related protein
VARQPRHLVWLVDTRDALREFPPEVRTKLGFGVYLAQIGLKHESAKPLHGFDVPVWEIRADDRSGTYRVVYVVQLRNAVYALHAFQKKSKAGIATPRRDLELIRQRLKLAKERDAQQGGSQ